MDDDKKDYISANESRVEIIFRGSVDEFISTVKIYGYKTEWKGTIPGPYAPIFWFNQEIPEVSSTSSNISFAQFKFSTRFSKIKGTLYASSLPGKKALVIADFPATVYENSYAVRSLKGVWEQFKHFLIAQNWIIDSDQSIRTPNSDPEKDSTQPNTERQNLLNLIKANYDLEELKELAYALDINFDDLAGNKLTTKVISLIELACRTSSIEHLATYFTETRPNEQWEQINWDFI
jgi:hypothetical protein